METETIDLKIINGVININDKNYTPLQAMKILGDIVFNVSKKQQMKKILDEAYRKDYDIINDLLGDKITLSKNNKKINIKTEQSITFNYKFKVLEIDDGKNKFNNKANNMGTLDKIISSM